MRRAVGARLPQRQRPSRNISYWLLLFGSERADMSKITYHIVQHDGGWAYQVNGVFSETFPSHDAARKAAERAAREQHVGGETRAISWEDKDGHWHEELARGDDR